MRALLLMGLAGCLSLEVRCQTWCPPGAEWWYDYWGTFGSQLGYVHLTYTSDTLIEGDQCQILNGYATGYDYWTDMPFYYPQPPVITRALAGQVFYRSGDEWILSFDLGASPTEQWLMVVDGANWDRVVTVEDTGHLEISGTELRYQVVSFDPPIGLNNSDTIIERIGFRNIAIEPPLTLGLKAPLQGLRCYQDEVISFSSGIAESCDQILGTEDLAQHGDFNVWPNPGEGHLSIKTNRATGTAQIIVRDAWGRTLFDQPCTSDRIELDTRSWASGVYALELRTTNGERTTTTWIKR